METSQVMVLFWVILTLTSLCSMQGLLVCHKHNFSSQTSYEDVDREGHRDPLVQHPHGGRDVHHHFLQDQELNQETQYDLYLNTSHLEYCILSDLLL